MTYAERKSDFGLNLLQQVHAAQEGVEAGVGAEAGGHMTKVRQTLMV